MKERGNQKILKQEGIKSATPIDAEQSQTTFANIVVKEKRIIRKKPSSETSVLLDSIIAGMQEIKAHDIVVMDLRKIQSAMADYFVVCSGNSNTQVQAIAQSVEKETVKTCQDPPWHTEGLKNAKWVLMDYVNVVVHIFDREARDFYALEDLWADADTKRIES